MIVLVGDVAGKLLAGLDQSPNVSVARPPGSASAAGPGIATGPGTATGPGPGILPGTTTDPRAGTRTGNRTRTGSGTGSWTEAGTGTGAGTGSRTRTGTDHSGAADAITAAPGWEQGALALREATRRRSTYVIVTDDPLAGVAAAWREMWDVAAGSPGAAGFERHAAQALAAWRDKRFELPDYYLVLAPAPDIEAGPDLYLGPLRAARPRRVAVAGAGARVGDDLAPAARLLDTLRSLEHGPWWPPLDDLLDAARRFFPGALAEA